MAELIIMPALSPTMTQGFLVRWHKNIGDEVKPGDLLMDVETDKAIMEVESTQGGIIDGLLHFTEAVSVGQVVGALRKKNENPGVGQKLLEDAPQNAKNKLENTQETQGSNDSQRTNISQNNNPSEISKDIHIPQGEISVSPMSSLVPEIHEKIQEKKPLLWSFDLEDNGGTIHEYNQESKTLLKKTLKASPYARKWAQDHHISLEDIPPHYSKGPRLKQQDVEAFYHDMKNDKVLETNGLYGVKSENAISTKAFTKERSLSPMQRVIAQRLSHSKATIPHFYLSLFCSMDILMNFRQNLNNQQKDIKFSVTDFIIKACALSIRDNPQFCQTWIGGDAYTVNDHSHVDISLAVALDDGLITPIIYKADTLDLRQLHDKSQDLIQRARKGSLKKEEFTGGVFTISNLGMMNVDSFLPIVNPPQSGILAVGSMRSRVVPTEDSLGFKTIQGITFTLAADHRMINGDVGAKFLTSLEQYLQNPCSLLF